VAYLAYVVDTKRKAPSQQLIPVIKEFGNVFQRIYPGYHPIEKLFVKLVRPGRELEM
jgi:hypothetical protein